MFRHMEAGEILAPTHFKQISEKPTQIRVKQLLLKLYNNFSNVSQNKSIVKENRRNR